MNTAPSKLHIMIYAVDDDKFWRILIEEALAECNLEEHQKYRVYGDVQTMFNEWTPDVHLCIIDYFLNGAENGLDVVKKVHERNPICHVILLSSQTDKKVIKDALNMGVNNYVDKSDGTVAYKELCEYIQLGIRRMNAFTIKFKNLIDRHNEFEQKVDNVTNPVTNKSKYPNTGKPDS